MKDSIKKAPVNLWEDLYFQHFIPMFDFAPNYHQLNMSFEADVVYFRQKKNKYGQFCAKYLSQYQKILSKTRLFRTGKYLKLGWLVVLGSTAL